MFKIEVSISQKEKEYITNVPYNFFPERNFVEEKKRFDVIESLIKMGILREKVEHNSTFLCLKLD